MRFALATVAAFFAMPAAAAELTLERLFADPPLSGPAPRALKLAPDGSRVTFLRGRADEAARLDLWEYSIATRRERLLVDSAQLAPGAERLSDAEQARRERLRIAAFSGIVDYHWAPDARSILFPLDGSLYLYALGRPRESALSRLTRAEDGFATDPKVSPGGRYVSFVRDRRLFAIELERGIEFALTPEPEAETVSYGMAEFVAQEEMGRLTGYWWAPDDSAVAYTRVDEAPVAVERRFEVHADRTDVIEQRYPAAGKANALVTLHVVALDPTAVTADATAARADGIVAGRATLAAQAIDLGPDTDIYLARVHWIDGARLAFQRQSRDQRRLDLVLHDRRDARQRTLLTETSRTWINLHDDLRVLREREQFLWASERSGLKQLYLYGLDGTLLRQVSDTPWAIESVLALDQRRDRVYVHAPGPDPLEKHVYAHSLDGGEPVRVTREPGWHEAVFSGDARYFVATHSDPATPPRVRLFEAMGRPLGVLEANAVVAGHPYHRYRAEHVLPEYGTLEAADGQMLYWALLKPRDFDPARRHPAIVRYYGGPGRQFVRRDFTVGINTGVTDLLSQYWVRQGYVVFALDNRGTPRRGKAFEDPLHRRMGRLEIEDQRRGIEWLARQPGIDPARIGSFGWSYGGYIALMLAAQANDLLTANAAVAPVTDWALYDTHYTERYMDHPALNPDGYAAGNVLRHADRIAGELLLVHGMADDNVLFSHSTALMALLQARAFPFELMTYPGGKHGLVGAAIRTHVYGTIDRFFARTLTPQRAR